MSYILYYEIYSTYITNYVYSILRTMYILYSILRTMYILYSNSHTTPSSAHMVVYSLYGRTKGPSRVLCEICSISCTIFLAAALGPKSVLAAALVPLSL